MGVGARAKRYAGLPHSQETATPQDRTVGPCLGSYGGPGELGRFRMCKVPLETLSPNPQTLKRCRRLALTSKEKEETSRLEKFNSSLLGVRITYSLESNRRREKSRKIRRKIGTYETDRTRIKSWLSNKSPSNIVICYLLAWQRKKREAHFRIICETG